MVANRDFNYRLIEDWGRGPAGREFGVVAGIAADSQDRIYVASRRPKPCVLVYDSQGCFLTSWGEEVFVQVGGLHGLSVSQEDHVYCTDVLEHTVCKFSLEGELLMTLGTPGRAGEPDMPFNMPTQAAASPSGDIYVSDGYGQSRIHCLSPEGELLRSWGSKGTGPGQFNTPHGICIDSRGRALVADRGNNRIQVFDADGIFLAEWPMPAPNDVYIDKDDHVYASDGIFNLEGERLAQVEGMMGHILSFSGVQEASRLQLTKVEGMMGHGLCVDSRGDIYWSTVGEIVPGRGFVETANLVKKLERA